jgi:antitoxin VapB
MTARRAQTPITIRSDRAAARLALLKRPGRSQASIIEEALERLPLPQPTGDAATRLRRLERIVEGFGGSEPRTMASFDAENYDDRGQPR